MGTAPSLSQVPLGQRMAPKPLCLAAHWLAGWRCCQREPMASARLPFPAPLAVLRGPAQTLPPPPPPTQRGEHWPPCPVPGSVLSTYYALSHQSTPPSYGYFYPHFTDKKTETQKEINLPKIT